MGCLQIQPKNVPKPDLENRSLNTILNIVLTTRVGIYFSRLVLAMQKNVDFRSSDGQTPRSLSLSLGLSLGLRHVWVWNRGVWKFSNPGVSNLGVSNPGVSNPGVWEFSNSNSNFKFGLKIPKPNSSFKLRGVWNFKFQVWNFKFHWIQRSKIESTFWIIHNVEFQFSNVNF